MQMFKHDNKEKRRSRRRKQMNETTYYVLVFPIKNDYNVVPLLEDDD
jgi:hypothetical protein